jgi:superfamily II DNA/RNA helicase
MLFSATLDAGIGVIAKRYLSNPVTHEADSAQSPISTMAHHVLHVTRRRARRRCCSTSSPPRAAPLCSPAPSTAPRSWPASSTVQGVPAVELHGNLSQNARTRTMEAFHSGAARTLVATDIAARGIHVDDVALVIHADPPVEHKAYTHRSGRTARAGASGTVVTLMTDDQVRDVRDLTRKAGVTATTTRVHAAHPLLQRARPRRAQLRGWLRCSRGSGVAAPGVGPAPLRLRLGSGLSPGLGSGSASWRPERRRVR